MNSIQAHKAVWLAGMLIPPAANIWGNFATGQRLFHALTASLVFFLIAWWSRNTHVKWSEGLSKVVAFTLLVCGYFTATTLYFSPFIQMSDLVEFVRPFNYLLYFLLPVIVLVKRDEFPDLMRFLLWMLLFQVVFSALVFVPELWSLVDFYKGRLSTDDVIFHFFRFSGTFGYPSDFSFYLIFFLLYLCFLVLGESSLQQRVMLSGLMFVSIAALFLTGSRSGLGLFVLLILAILFTHRLVLKPIVLLGIGFVFAGVFYLFAADILDENVLSSLTYIADLLEQGTQDASAKHRLKEFSLAVEMMVNYFPFGFGANKDYFSFVLGPVESTYGYYMGKYGFVGIVLFLLHIGFLARVALKVSKLYRDDKYIVAFANAFFLWSLSVPLVFGFASAVTDRFRGPLLFYLCAGYLMALYFQRRERQEQC